jgi:hypothetical protein
VESLRDFLCLRSERIFRVHVSEVCLCPMGAVVLETMTVGNKVLAWADSILGCGGVGGWGSFFDSGGLCGT